MVEGVDGRSSDDWGDTLSRTPVFEDTSFNESYRGVLGEDCVEEGCVAERMCSM